VGHAVATALDFSGQVAIVTGGGRGVGRGISERFLECGADVVICGRNAPDTLLARARELAGDGEPGG